MSWDHLKGQHSKPYPRPSVQKTPTVGSRVGFSSVPKTPPKKKKHLETLYDGTTLEVVDVNLRFCQKLWGFAGEFCWGAEASPELEGTPAKHKGWSHDPTTKTRCSFIQSHDPFKMTIWASNIPSACILHHKFQILHVGLLVRLFWH